MFATQTTLVAFISNEINETAFSTSASRNWQTHQIKGLALVRV